MPQHTIYYHADCLDGFGAAYAAWRRFGDSALYRPMHHGDAWAAEDVAAREVFILDFSFPVDELRAMAGLARSVRVIDHHISARRPWADRLPAAATGLACHTEPDLPLTVAFDLDKSGARLAWEHFQPDVPLPPAIAHIEDRDLWRFAIAGTQAFCRALQLQPFDFARWDALIAGTASPETPGYRRMLADGEAIERFFILEVERLADSKLVMPAVLPGDPIDPLQALRHGQPSLDDGERSWRRIDGLAINANALFASELGHRLAQRSGSFGLIWHLAANGEIRASLRADGKVNVATLAEHFGGGGHANAAGFRLPANRFFKEVLQGCPGFH